MKVLFIDRVHPYLEEQLKLNGFTCVMAFGQSAKQIDSTIHDYDGIVIRSRIQLDAERLSKAKKLKFIARAGSGLENIDTKYCNDNNIQCYNAPEANCIAVAEHALGMILSLFNNLTIADKEMRSGLWRREENRGVELGKKTLGIIGYGHNGSAFARLVKAFGTRILAYDKYFDIEEDGIENASLEDIYAQADIISFHVPLKEDTHYYFDKSFIEKMNNPFYLINTSRGAVVNTDALVEGLKSSKILGACLDVLEYEKSNFEALSAKEIPSLDYLLNSDKVLLSPHVAGWTHESLLMISEVLADKILGGFAGSSFK